MIETKSNNQYSIYLIVALFVCSVCYGFLPQWLLSSAVVILVVLSFFSDEFFYVFPFLIFYYSVYGSVFGISVFRLYSLLLLAKMLMKRYIKIIPKQLLFPLVVYLLFSVTVFFPLKPQTAFFNLISIFCVLTVIVEIFSDFDKTKRFFSIYSLVALESFITGIVHGNTINYAEVMVSEYVEMNRFMATFEDPNYMGFFFLIAIFAPIVLNLFSTSLRIIVVVLLSITLFMSISMTALIGYVLIWAAYLILGKKKGVKFWLILTGVVLILLVLYRRGILDSIPFINVFLKRIKTKLTFLQIGDYVGATSNRVNRYKEHFSYFLKEPIFKQLFGGNFVTTYGSNLKGLDRAVAHNEYIDLLLNVGIIGEAILLGYLGWSTYRYIKDYLLYNCELDLMKVILKLIWAYYALTLTFFMDFRFMFPFFV